jgi:bacillopeptidase F
MSETKIPERPALPKGAVNAGPYGDILIAKMKTKADLSSFQQMPRGAERKTAVYNSLLEAAKKSQAPVLGQLDTLKGQGLVSSYESMFLPNAISIHAAPGKYQAVADALKGVAEIQALTPNKTWQIPVVPGSKGLVAAPSTAGTVEWGVDRIGAPKAWAKGYRGQGVTVGVVDTGLDTSHPAIHSHYRGTKADGTVDDNYNWFDPTSPGKLPYDDGDHGTHVGGTIAGGTADYATGVAPDAKLIAAKAIISAGYNTTDATLKALQFMLAPTDVNGKNPDPTKGADVINNSWGNADRNDTTFVDTWDGLLAAGIVPVTAAGNDGPMGKVSPPGSYPQGISVAASTSSDKVAGFSSRGPSNFDPKAVVPMVAAPGAGITSSIPGGKYARWDGTSMASPHVAGAVALMLSAKPNATYDEITKALQVSAVDIDQPGADVNAGYGRIDVDRAIDALLHPAAEKKSA